MSQSSWMQAFCTSVVIGLGQAPDVHHWLCESNKVPLWRSQVVLHVQPWLLSAL